MRDLRADSILYPSLSLLASLILVQVPVGLWALLAALLALLVVLVLLTLLLLLLVGIVLVLLVLVLHG